MARCELSARPHREAPGRPGGFASPRLGGGCSGQRNLLYRHSPRALKGCMSGRGRNYDSASSESAAGYPKRRFVPRDPGRQLVPAKRRSRTSLQGQAL